MTEKIFILDDIDIVSFYGTNNCNITIIKSLFPKIRITARDNILRAFGDEVQLIYFNSFIDKVRQHLLTYNNISEKDIINIANGSEPLFNKTKDTIVYSKEGKAIKARNENQTKLVEAFQEKDLIFAIGPAGTGKTYLSIALAVKALKEKIVKKIILSRPAVEAGEKLGFLPGDMKEKIDPYLQPLYDALDDMMPSAKLQDMIEKRVIEIAPLAFMRGRTLNNAIIILDEAQNTSTAQLRMFLTRLGTNSKMIVTGDLTQIDLPKGVACGLKEATNILSGVDDIAFIRMTKSDIVRHRLVEKIVDAYDEADLKKQKTTTND